MKLRKYSIAVICVLVLTVVCAALMPNQVAAETGVTTLYADEAIVTISEDTVLDLNGFNIDTLTVAEGVTAQVKDSQTDDYTVEDGIGYGEIATVNGTVVAEDGYLMITDGGVSFHKLEMRVSGATLRTAKDAAEGTGIYYTCTFGGDEIVKQNVKAFGVAMGAGRNPDFRAGTYTQRTTDAWSVGGEFEGNSTLLKGIMKTENAYSVNVRNSGIDVYCRAFVQLSNNQRVTGEVKKASLHDFVELADSLTSSFNAEQKAAASLLYTSFENIIDTWCVPQIRQLVTGGAYQIRNVRDLKVLYELPGESHILTEDLNMAGVDFTPVESFSGTFDGNNHTIRNLTVDSTTSNYSGYIGMFLSVESGAEIKNLNVANITVDASATAARFIGTLAGYNKGTIADCTATGTIIDDQPGTEDRLIFVGAIAGRAGDNSVTRGATTLSVVDTVKDVNGKTVTYTTTGLCAKVKMNVPDSPYVMKRVVGNFSATNVTYSGDWQDLSFSTEDESALAQSRRQTAVKAMYEMGTFKWTVPNLNGTSTSPDLIHYGTTASNKETHVHTQKFYNGTTYYGIPYDHTSSSYEQAMFYMDEGANGVYVLNNTAASAGNSTWGGENDKDAYGNALYRGFTKYIGNDCSGAVAWAWHHAAPRYVKAGGVYVLLSSNMMPNDAAEETYGIYRVGPYTVTDDMTATVDGKAVVTSPAVAEANGTNTMYESYARTQMGDALMYGEPGGHARLAAADSVVIRNKNGGIYKSKSYILIHEQGDGLYDRATTNSSWRINYKYTFDELYNGTAKVNGKTTSSGKGYLPITLKAFHDDSVRVLYSAPYEYTTTNDPQKITTPALGQINAGNRILCATVVVKDSAGKVVYQKTAYKGETGIYNTYRSTYLSMIMKYYFSDYVNYVKSGQTYTFSVDCTVAGGTLNADGTISNTTTTVIKNRSFTHS